jgi:hypothetical protein
MTRFSSAKFFWAAIAVSTLLLFMQIAAAQEEDADGAATETAEVEEPPSDSSLDPNTPTPVPTSTLVPTATPVPTDTPIPATATPVVSPTPDTAPRAHGLPEPRPTSGPQPPSDAASSYLATTLAGFAAEEPSGQQPWTARYVLVLEPTFLLPSDAYLEAHFESPTDPELAITGERVPGGSNRIRFMSAPLTGIHCRDYYAEVHVYRDASRSTELGKHIQWIRSGFDLERVRGASDLVGRRTC